MKLLTHACILVNLSVKPHLLIVRIANRLHALIGTIQRIPRQYNFMISTIILICVAHITWQRALGSAKVWARWWSIAD